jgi:hypothetical protein
MNKSILFAIDWNTEETIISESEKGSAKINLIEEYNPLACIYSLTKIYDLANK